MVSPYKKKKQVEKKGRDPALEVNSLKYPGSRRTRTSIKPLTDKKFYLDIKNHTSLKKLEAKLTSLGARLELFLVREVDYVVTDREDYPKIIGGNRSQQVPTPSPLPSFCSVSPATPTSPHDGLNPKRTRSRAEAMLERVRHQPQTKNTGDILDNAITWRIPIYPLPRFIDWLEKVVKKTEKLYDNGGQIVEKGVRELRGTYLKVETSSRPEFRHFNSWPNLGLNKDTSNHNNRLNGPQLPPQLHRNHSNEAQRMTRKAGKAAKEASSAPGGGNGYCEMCRIHYDHLDTHVTSVEHLKLVTDPSQYSHLDSIIAQHNLGVSSLRRSLRIGRSPPPYLPPEMGGRQSSEPTVNNIHCSSQVNGHVTRSKTAANALSSPNTPIQPTVHIQCNGVDKRRSKPQSRCDSPPLLARNQSNEAAVPPTSPTIPAFQEHYLRSRRSLRTTPPPVNCTKQQSPVIPSPPAALPITRQQHQQSNLHTPPNQQIIKPTLPPPPRRTSRVIRKRLSVEEKLIEDNKSYYKVEVLSSKLRSTEYFISQNKIENSANNRLNGTVPGAGVTTSATQPETKCLQEKSPVKAPVVVRFKKVRKTELAVLSDEAESFMFGEPKKPADDSSDSSDEDDEQDEEETCVKKVEPDEEEDVKPNISTLRPPPSPNLSNNGSLSSQLSQLQDIKEDPDDLPAEKREIMFSFDIAPLREPWLETYQRLDEGKEIYIPQYHAYPSILLPYQCPPEKLHNYKRYLGSHTSTPTIFPPPAGDKRRNRLSKLLDDRPRKSPRCHASTLAIMSSLMRRHRPGRECDRTFTYEEDSSMASDTVVESSSNSERLLNSQQQSSNGTYNSNSSSSVQQAILSAVLKPEGVDQIGEALLNGKTEISSIEPCLTVDPTALTDAISFVTPMDGLQMDINELMATYQECSSLDKAALEQAPPRPFESVRFGADSCASSDCSDLFGFLDDGRVVSKKRKRKRNMTGWPQPKRRVIHNNNNNAATPATSSSRVLRDILEDEPPVDINKFQCVKVVRTNGSSSFTATDLVRTPKRRGRPPKSCMMTPASTPAVLPSTTTKPYQGNGTPNYHRSYVATSSSMSSSPLKRKLHRFYTNRRSFLK